MVFKETTQLLVVTMFFIAKSNCFRALKKVVFLYAKESIVATKAVESWSELFQQRVRWASKSTGYSSVYGKLVALVVFVGNLAWILSFLLMAHREH